MMIPLFVKNKIGFIDGSIAKPDNSDDQVSNWIRNNNIVISWILNSVSKEISASVIYSESAHDIWIDLKERFQQRNGPRIFQLRRELMNLTQGQLSVGVYFTKLKTIWEELSNYRPICSCGKCSCGENKKLSEHYQMEYVMSFLMGLNDTFAQGRGQLLLMDPMPSINKVFSLVSQEEHQRNISINAGISNTGDSMAFYAKIDPKKGSLGQHKFQKKEKPICTYCKLVGHSVDKCYKLHGYPPGYKMKQRSNFTDQVDNQPRHIAANQVVFANKSEQAHTNAEDFMHSLNHTQYQQLMNMLGNHLTSAKTNTRNDEHTNQVSGTCFSIVLNPCLNSPKHWVMDSGATSHICFSKSAFYSMKLIENAYVTLPNHKRIPVSFVGIVKFSNNLMLEDVLYVPNFKFNLMSVSSLIKDSNIIVRFFANECDIQDTHNQKMIGKGRRSAGLYIISATALDSFPTHSRNLSIDKVCVSVSSVVNKVNANTWHHRLGHLSFKKLAPLKDSLGLKFDQSKDHNSIPSNVCPLAKQRRLSFVSNNHFSANAFDLVHCDTWGPYHVASHSGHRYFLTLVNDSTRFTWVYLMKHKSK
ncbi:uncharacterized protein LOC111377235, partial [Olea europaea var. sylvestris]|uniref:uncharacterized protein LOC111377235 n=1 Tax=Olea europaea var. sylvestris TaxID=158386 RepID=UPI000C1D86DF